MTSPNRQNSFNGSSCNVLSSPSTNFLFTKNWENIPEIIVFNGLIGLALFIVFIIFTRIAWKRSKDGDKNESYIGQNLITYLYGFRDPERWAVLPRLEFLRCSDRHHNHNLKAQTILLPPKLPSANPIFMSGLGETANINHDSLLVRSVVSNNLGYSANLYESDRLAANKLVQAPTLTKSKSPERSWDVNQDIYSPKSIEPNRTDDSGSGIGRNGHNELNGQVSLENSFFYPSILTAEQMQASFLSRKLNRFFSFFFRVTDADLIYAKGIDAYEYLLFQRHLILIMFITNFFCLCLILPVHWFSSPRTALMTTSFQHTIIKNMSNNSLYYWVHIISSVCILILTVLILGSYRDSIVDKNNSKLARRTLLIGNIPIEQRSKSKLIKIIEDYFSLRSIDAIQFVYDTSILDKLYMQLDSTIVAKNYCLYHKKKYSSEIMVRQTDVNEEQRCDGYCRFCSFIYVCFCYWPFEKRGPGTLYYNEKEKYYRSKINELFKSLMNHPSEYAFVTFRSHRQARMVLEKLSRIKVKAISEEDGNMTLSKQQKHHQSDSILVTNKDESASTKDLANDTGSNNSFNHEHNDPLDPKNNPHIRSIRDPIVKKVELSKDKKNNLDIRGNLSKSETSKSVITKLDGPLGWSARYAPFPDNVAYHDLLNLATTSKYTIFLWHLLMIIIFIFITTPNVLLSIFERLTRLQPEKVESLSGFQRLFINYLSTLLQVITTALLPALIVLISKQIPYEDSASKTHSMMWKSYLFLVLMIIILPSVGMSSAQAFISTRLNPECIFPTDNGAHYIKYVVSSIFLSPNLELIKPIDILSYCFILFTSRSFADFEGGRQFIEREFSVSMQHTRVLVIFAVVMTYALSCPLIAPVGLVYLLVKHAVDHHQLYYTYFTKKVDKNLQTTIEIFVKVALLLMLFQTTVAITLNTGTSLVSLVSQIVFWISLAVFLFNCFFHYTSKAMMTSRLNRYQREFCACFYLPNVIQNLIKMKAVPESCISRKI